MMVVTLMSRKRKFSFQDGDSLPPKREAKEEGLVLGRSLSKDPSSLDEDSCHSPLRAAAKFSHKPSLAPMSFYGQQKSLYLTPLQRKSLKESLPIPLSSSLAISTSLAKKPEKKRGKISKQQKRGGPREVRVSASAKRIKLPKLSCSYVKEVQSAPSTNKTLASVRKQFNFSTMKTKPKILVGASFFSTKGKQHTRKRHQNRTQREAKLEKQEKLGSEEVDPVVDRMDCDAKAPKTPKTSQPLRFPAVQLKRFGISQEVRVLLRRSPSAQQSFPAQSSNTKKSCESDVLSPALDAPASPRGLPAVYPIFGSASKRKWSALQIGVCETSSSVNEPSGRRRKERPAENQLIIDAGQKQFGATACSSCGMVYSQDNPEDTFQHSLFHQRLLRSIRYLGWKKERLVAEFWDGKIVLVLPNDSKYALKKVEDIRHVVDNELGFQQATLGNLSQARTYLFINTQQLVVGCLLAEPIQRAYRVLEQMEPQNDKTDFLEPQRAWCCSTVAEPALCGVSRIWVLSQARRQGVATRMLDTLRFSFLYGNHLNKDEIAFSDPTPDGKLLATKYCNTPTFLVYNSF